MYIIFPQGDYENIGKLFLAEKILTFPYFYQLSEE